MVTTSDVHVDSALHIPKRNKRLRRTPAKGYNAPMTTSKVSTPMALPNKGRMTPTDQTRGFSAPEGNVAYADEKKNKEFAAGRVTAKVLNKSYRRIIRSAAKKGHPEPTSAIKRAKKITSRLSPEKRKQVLKGWKDQKHRIIPMGDDDFDENEFAVGALAKVGLGLFKKKKQIVPGTSVKSGLSRLQPRRTSSTLSPSGQAQKKAADAQKIASKKAATASTRTADSQRRRTQAAKNPLLSTKAGKQARRLKRGIKRNPTRSAAIAAGAGLGAGYLLSNDEDFGTTEFAGPIGSGKLLAEVYRRRGLRKVLKLGRTAKKVATQSKEGLKTGITPPKSSKKLDRLERIKSIRARRKKAKITKAVVGTGLVGAGAGTYLAKRNSKNSDVAFTEADFAALDKIVKNVRENSKNSDGEFADETKKERYLTSTRTSSLH